MKTLFLKLSFSALLLMLGTAVGAQVSSSNSFGIFPASQTSFNPNGKFTAIGESGGVPGATSAGCDLYGFRAQTNPNTGVSLGIRTFQINLPFLPSPFTAIGPALVTSANGLVITEQNGTNTGACGNALATFNEVSSSNNVLTIFGSATASGGSWTTSDRKLKRNIETIKNPMAIINGLTGYTYEYRSEELAALRLPTGTRYGFITQEVEKVMPTAVREADGLGDELLGFQVMEYNAVIPVLTEAIKLHEGTITTLEAQNAELERENADLKETTRDLETRLARLEALLLKEGASSAAQPSTLGNFDAVRLGQNRPNPTDGNTAIDYTLPSSMTNAFLVVVDINGRQIAKQAITDAKGVVELNTSKWSAGTYIYSIVADGETLARKKMLVQ